MNPNHLLAFSYQEDEAATQQSRGQHYGGRRRKQVTNINKYLSKDQVVQQRLKFIVKKDRDYLQNIYDPNEEVEWKDIVQVISNMISAEDVKCPICMEKLDAMVSPRITKCGHIYCWPCILQYLAFEKDRNWKQCPLCNDMVSKQDLKSVNVV